MTRLEEELRCAVEDAVVGQPLRAGLGGRARAAAMGVLVRRNIRNAQVSVRQEGAGLAVDHGGVGVVGVDVAGDRAPRHQPVDHRLFPRTPAR